MEGAAQSGGERVVIRPRREPPEPRGPEAYAAELLGTFVLVFFICTAVSVAGGLGVTDFVLIGLVHAFALAALVYTLGGISGAHVNPAVTVTLAALRKIGVVDAVIYVLVQLAGAVAAALVVKLLLDDPGRVVDYGAPSLSDLVEGKAGLGLIAEGIGTFILVWAVMGMAVNPKAERSFAGLVIGLALGLAVLAIAPMTGGSFNPARAFGPALVAGQFADFWVYVLAPLAGGLLAGGLYTLVVLRPQHRDAQRPVDTLPS